MNLSDTAEGRNANLSKRPGKQARKEDPWGLDPEVTSSTVVITRQRSAQRLITMTSAPKCWPVPRDGCNTAYLLDLRASALPWTRNGKVMSMVAIIKAEVRRGSSVCTFHLCLTLLQDQDAWGGGTSGSATQTYKVRAFGPDPVDCRYAEHVCQGVYYCSRIDMGLLEGCERFEPRYEDQHELASLEHDLDTAQRASPEVRAAM